MSSSLRTRSAFHAAGHAVSAVLLGLPVQSFGLDSCARAPFDVAPDAAIVVETSGAVAESIRFPRSCSLSDLMRESAFSDFVRIGFRLGSGPRIGGEIRTAESFAIERSARILREHWPAVRCVASHLWTGRALSAAFVQDVIDGMRRPKPRAACRFELSRE
jgi:hypothetical protein